MAYVINKKFTTVNHTALKRTAQDIKYIVVHYVGALGDAKANAEYYQSVNRSASADFYVGHTGDIWQGNDYYNYYSWHCGGGKQSSEGASFYKTCTNANSIGIEMCVKKKSTKTMNATDTDWYFEEATVASATVLVKSLMKELGIDADHVIRHFDVNGKYCPNPYVVHSGAWEGFKARLEGSEVKQVWYRVRKSWTDRDSQKGAYASLENAKAECDKWAGHSVYNDAGEAVYTAKSAPSTADGEFDGNGIPPSKKAYIEAVAKVAVELYPTTRILPSVVIAQCCLETGYGLGADSTILVQHNNLLGMKAELLNSTWSDHTAWDGKSISKVTPEYIGGKLIHKTDSFRAYPDYRTCILDYERFLLYVKNGSGYKYRAVQGKTDPAEVIHIIRAGGYATDPAYETKVMKLISENNFTKYDTAKEQQKGGKTMAKTILEALAIIKSSVDAGGWQYSNSGQSSTFDDAVNNHNKRVNCALAVSWALKMIGDLSSGSFWGNKGKIIWKGTAKEQLQAKGYSILKCSKTVSAAIKSGAIQPGDICMYANLVHTNVYAGSGYWYDFGRGYSGGATIEPVPLTKVYGKTIYADQKLSYIIRKVEKKPADKKTTVYRVRVGIYQNKSIMKNTAAVLKKAGFDTFAEPNKNGTALICGSYSDRKNAEIRAAQLQKVKVSGKYLNPAIVATEA